MDRYQQQQQLHEIIKKREEKKQRKQFPLIISKNKLVVGFYFYTSNKINYLQPIPINFTGLNMN